MMLRLRKKQEIQKVFCSKCRFFTPVNNCTSPKNLRQTWKGMEYFYATQDLNYKNRCKFYEEKDAQS